MTHLKFAPPAALETHPAPARRHAEKSIVVLPREEAEAWIPRPGEVAISIANPRQSRAQLSRDFADVVALGFHDTDREGGGFTTMNQIQARAVLTAALAAQDKPFMVHCQAGASRSVGVALFLAAWLQRPLEIIATDVLIPNTWVINQLRAAGVRTGFRHRNTRLLRCGLFGSIDWLSNHCAEVRLGSSLALLPKQL